MMSRANRIVTVLTAGLLASASLSALAEVTRDPAQVQGGEFAVDGNHTQIGFTLSHFGLSDFSGRLAGVSGTLSLQTANISASKLSVSVPTASFSTPVDKLSEELRGADWFDADKYPTITFTSTKVTQTGKDSATIAGDLTLHGVTKPVTLTAHLVGAGENPINKKYTVGFDATGTVKRSEFGVTKYLPLVGDEVEVTLHGAFERK